MNEKEKTKIPGVSGTRVLTECAMMVALATVLSLLKIAQMPAGGSVTAAAMMPIILISYRHGTKAGLSSAFVFAALQALLGMKNFSYVSGWASVIAVLLCDYLLAYVVIGAAGLFDRENAPVRTMATGTVFVCFCRYLCHTVGGAVVWAECAVALPNAAAWGYSAAYNATYMIPETFVTVLVVSYVGSVLDLSKAEVRPMKKGKGKGRFPYFAVGSLLAVIALIFDVVTLFMYTQDGEGFSLSALRSAPLPLLIVVGILGAAFYIAGVFLEKRAASRHVDTPRP